MKELVIKFAEFAEKFVSSIKHVGPFKVAAVIIIIGLVILTVLYIICKIDKILSNDTGNKRDHDTWDDDF